jgi:hypothetical protein
MKIPNILLILADDVGTGDVPGYWGNHIVEMPNLMKLQSQGVTFMDAHSTPLCAPSRYMLLSGNYVHRGTNYNGSWGLRKQTIFEINKKVSLIYSKTEPDTTLPRLESGILVPVYLHHRLLVVISIRYLSHP